MMNHLSRTFLKTAALITCVALFALLAVFSTKGYSAVKVAGETPHELFADPRVAALTDASANGRVSEAQRLIETGVPVDAKGSRNITPLAFALLAANARGVETLLKAGADPNHRIDDPTGVGGLPIVMFLPQTDHTELLRLMLDYGADPNTKQPPRAETFDKFPFEGGSLLTESVMSLANVKMLVEHGADVNYRPEYGVANPNGGIDAAVRAAGLGQLPVVQYLLDHGSNVGLDGIADALQSRRWAPEVKAIRIGLLRRLHTMGAHIYSGFQPIKSPKPEYYVNTDTPPELISPGLYQPRFYTGNAPFKRP